MNGSNSRSAMPNPTSSARMQPPSGTRRSANMTASTWCGLGFNSVAAQNVASALVVVCH